MRHTVFTLVLVLAAEDLVEARATAQGIVDAAATTCDVNSAELRTGRMQMPEVAALFPTGADVVQPEKNTVAFVGDDPPRADGSDLAPLGEQEIAGQVVGNIEGQPENLAEVDADALTDDENAAFAATNTGRPLVEDDAS